jgi:HD-GYP domain-containing protein (c-di-GMP phosphodiesterase class II)
LGGRQDAEDQRSATDEEGFLRHSGRALLLSLYAALRSLKLYPLENETVQKALDDLQASAGALIEAEDEIEVRMAGDFIFVNSTRLRLELDNYASFSQILSIFRTFDIGTLHVGAKVERREWQVFLSLLLSLSTREDPEDLLDELQSRLARADVAGLSLEPRSGAHDMDEQEMAREMAKRTYSQGVAVTKDVVNSVRMGRAASIKRVKRVVQGIVDQVLNNETSLIGLTTLRDYDEYTFTHSVNVCIFSIALGKKIGLTKTQLYDLGLAALLHDVGKARVPLDVLNKTTSLDEDEWRIIQEHPWTGALTLFTMRGYDETPYRSILVAYEHHMKTDLTGYPRSRRSRELGIYSKLVAVADGFDAATTRRSYQTIPIQPDEVLREMWENPRRGYDKVMVKALINLMGVYPVGTCVILDTFEVAVVAQANPDPAFINRPLLKVVINEDGAVVPPPGKTVDLGGRDAAGNFLHSIVKVTNPERYGITVGDYFV